MLTGVEGDRPRAPPCTSSRLACARDHAWATQGEGQNPWTLLPSRNASPTPNALAPSPPAPSQHTSDSRPRHPPLSASPHRSRHGVPIILSEDLVRDAEGTLSLLCCALGMAPDPAMLDWEVGPKPEDGPWAPWWYAGSHASTGFGKGGGGPGASAVKGRTPLDPTLRPLLEECQALYAVLSRRALRPRSARPGGGLLSLDSGACPVHRGGTHEYAPDSRNDDTLVGMRDGVTGVMWSSGVGGRGEGKLECNQAVAGGGSRWVDECIPLAASHLCSPDPAPTAPCRQLRPGVAPGRNGLRAGVWLPPGRRGVGGPAPAQRGGAVCGQASGAAVRGSGRDRHVHR